MTTEQMQISLLTTVNEAQTILNALSTLPYNQVSELIPRLKASAEAQIAKAASQEVKALPVVESDESVV
jgi:hypothetical protein